MLLCSADLKHSLGVPEAGLGTTGPPACPKLDHHRPAAGTARLAWQAERPTHHLPPAPALAVVSASSGSSSLPSLTWESNPVKLSGRHAAGADLRQSAYTCRPCLWPPQPPAAPTYYPRDTSSSGIRKSNVRRNQRGSGNAVIDCTAPVPGRQSHCDADASTHLDRLHYPLIWLLN